nr:cancer/testis antigen 47B-like [Marmota flaviventris]
MDRDLGPDVGDMAPEAIKAQVTGPGVVEVPEPKGGPKEEEGAQAPILPRAWEGGDAEEYLDVGPTEEEGGDLAESQDIVVDTCQLLMLGFWCMFLDLDHSLLHHIYYNYHTLLQSLRSQVNQRSRSRSTVLSSSSERQVMQMPQRRRTRAMTQMIQGESQGLGLGPGLGLSLGLSLGFSLGLSLSQLDTAASIPVAQHTTQSSIAIQDPEQQAEEVVEKEPAEEIIAQITDVRGEEMVDPQLQRR